MRTQHFPWRIFHASDLQVNIACAGRFHTFPPVALFQILNATVGLCRKGRIHSTRNANEGSYCSVYVPYVCHPGTHRPNVLC